jgi:phage terminase large subunit-like protein
MQYQIDERRVDVIANAVAEGKAPSPEAFIEALIDRYSERHARRQQLDRMLDEAESGSFSRYESCEEMQAALRGKLDARIERRQV